MVGPDSPDPQCTTTTAATATTGTHAILMTGEWVSTGEAAEVLEVPMRELYRMIDRGEVPARRCGPTLKAVPVGPPAAVAGGALKGHEPRGCTRTRSGVQGCPMWLYLIFVLVLFGALLAFGVIK